MRRDINQLAKMVVNMATESKKKNPEAVKLGRLGGLKGGNAGLKN